MLRIIEILDAKQQGGALAALARADRRMYALIKPLLYARVGRTAHELVAFIDNIARSKDLKKDAAILQNRLRAVKHLDIRTAQSVSAAAIQDRTYPYYWGCLGPWACTGNWAHTSIMLAPRTLTLHADLLGVLFQGPVHAVNSGRMVFLSTKISQVEVLCLHYPSPADDYALWDQVD
jgi:hypothetical protein